MSDYLVHFNKNHDKLGRFATGDGDGDGKRNDRKKQRKSKDKSYLRSLKEAFEEGMREEMQRNERFSEQQRRDASQAQAFVNQAVQNHQDMVNQEAIRAGEQFMQQQLEFNRQQMMWF